MFSLNSHVQVKTSDFMVRLEKSESIRVVVIPHYQYAASNNPDRALLAAASKWDYKRLEGSCLVLKVLTEALEHKRPSFIGMHSDHNENQLLIHR